jgi:hypothetical protein
MKLSCRCNRGSFSIPRASPSGGFALGYRNALRRLSMSSQRAPVPGPTRYLGAPARPKSARGADSLSRLRRQDGEQSFLYFGIKFRTANSMIVEADLNHYC